jgi:hypothetical protein
MDTLSSEQYKLFLQRAVQDEDYSALHAILGFPYLRGVLLKDLFEYQASIEIYKYVLELVWGMDYKSVFAVASNKQQLEDLFAYARMLPPKHWPERVKLYRGTSNLDLADARKGICWTSHYQEACFFAMRGVDFQLENITYENQPIVLMANVQKHDIVYYNYSNPDGVEDIVLVGRTRGLRYENPIAWARRGLSYKVDNAHRFRLASSD